MEEKGKRICYRTTQLNNSNRKKEGNFYFICHSKPKLKLKNGRKVPGPLPRYFSFPLSVCQVSPERLPRLSFPILWILITPLVKENFGTFIRIPAR